MIISPNQMFVAGASGLQAASNQIKISSNNIANSDTIGFSRDDVVYSNRNIIAGVNVTAQSSYDKNLEKAKNAAANNIASDEELQAAVTQLETTTTNSNISDAWTGFVNAVYDFRQRGDPTANKEKIDAAAINFTQTYNKWVDTVSQLKTDYTNQLNANQNKLSQLQVQLLSTTDPTTQSSLRAELSTLEGKIKGQGMIVTKIIPELQGISNVAMDIAISTVNSDINTTAFIKTVDANKQGKLSYDGSNVATNVMNGASMSSDPMIIAMKKAIQQIGDIAHQIDINNKSNTNMQYLANNNYQNAVGVDIVTETLKISRAQQMYSACAKCIQAEDSNFKSLIAVL